MVWDLCQGSVKYALRARSDPLPVFFLNKVLLEHSMFIFFFFYYKLWLLYKQQTRASAVEALWLAKPELFPVESFLEEGAIPECRGRLGRMEQRLTNAQAPE